MRGALRGSSFAWEGTASMRGAVRGSVKGCCRARRLRARRSLFSLINFLPRTVPRPAFILDTLEISGFSGGLNFRGRNVDIEGFGNTLHRESARGSRLPGIEAGSCSEGGSVSCSGGSLESWSLAGCS